MDLFFFEITLPWPGGVRGAIESAAPLGHGVLNCSRYLRIQEPDGIRTLRQDLHGLGPKSSESRFFEGPFFGPFFGPPFSDRGSITM